MPSHKVAFFFKFILKKRSSFVTLWDFRQKQGLIRRGKTGKYTRKHE